MSELVIDCDGKLVTDCAGKLVVGCPPKYICSELTLNPELRLKFTWSGTLNRCTDCWDIYDMGTDFVQCLSAPTSLPNAAGVKQCTDPWDPYVQVDLPTFLVMQYCDEACGVGFGCGNIRGRYARFYWYCSDGAFYLHVLAVTLGGSHFPLFNATAVASDLKDGDTLNNGQTCLGDLPYGCRGADSVAFVTGGSYKVEIDNS
jgi:hypothetical protein